MSNATKYEKNLGAGSVSILLGFKGKSVGLKVSQLMDGGSIVTLREIEGKQLGAFRIPAGSSQSAQTKVTGKLPDNSTFSVWSEGVAKNELSFGTDLDGLKIVSNINASDDTTPQPSAQGLWQWIKNAASDIASAVGAGAAFATGGDGAFPTSNGGVISVLSGGGSTAIGYRGPGEGKFKSEPGLEEQPTVWY